VSPGLLDYSNGMSSEITQSKLVLGGTPVFRGTRVPVKALIDYLEGGDTIEIFLQDFPSVSRSHSASAGMRLHVRT